MTTLLIVNGDDFGMGRGINRGILEAHREGILTSASLMAVGGAFEEAVALAQENPSLSIGVHLTLVEGSPVLPPASIPSLVAPDGRFFGAPRAFLLKWLTGQIQVEEIQRELEAQVQKVMAHGVHIEHLDSHMHLHLLPGILRTVLALAQKYRIRGIRLPREAVLGQSTSTNVPMLIKRLSLAVLSRLQARRIAAAELYCSDHFAGITESGRLTEEALMRLLHHLKPGVTEIMIHPGYRDTDLACWPRSQQYDRARELRALTSPRVKTRVQELEIRLVSYREYLTLRSC